MISKIKNYQSEIILYLLHINLPPLVVLKEGDVWIVLLVRFEAITRIALHVNAKNAMLTSHMAKYDLFFVYQVELSIFLFFSDVLQIRSLFYDNILQMLIHTILLKSS